MKINMETFGNLMDDFMKENTICMLITMPEGTIEPEIRDNIDMGPVLGFYILLQAMEKVLTDLCDVLEGIDKEKLLRGCVELIYKDCLEGEEKVHEESLSASAE